jgi:RHS repeat-associated protein
MLLPNRHGSVDSDSYRYGFQGQERDDELKGEGNSYNYRYRMQDVRLGRFFAIDPLAKIYPMLSSYQFASNSVIAKAEIEGLEGGWVINGGKATYVEGPILDAYDSKEAVYESLNVSSQRHDNYLPIGHPTFTQQTESREVLAKRKANIEYQMQQRELMRQTFSNPGLQIAHGVYVGVPEGLMEVSGLMIVDKGIDA